ncbi:MAG: peptide chain release factor N(5)-glutamine methyltransferase, partial [Halothiobacillus sp.]
MKPSEPELIPLSALLAEGRAILSANTSAEPQVDARLLIEHATGLNRTRQLANPDGLVPMAQAEQARAAFARRAGGEPVAYIVGYRSFWHHDFLVTKDTLIPRPETEHLVEWALDKIPLYQEVTVIDLGTGSGAIALSLAIERPNALVIGCDLSRAALRVARANQAQMAPNAPKPVGWINGHWACMLKAHRADLIVSNPPYIAADDPHLNQGDVRFEPRSALVAEGEGLDDYRVIIKQAYRVLKPGGWLIFE